MLREQRGGTPSKVEREVDNARGRSEEEEVRGAAPARERARTLEEELRGEGVGVPGCHVQGRAAQVVLRVHASAPVHQPPDRV